MLLFTTYLLTTDYLLFICYYLPTYWLYSLMGAVCPLWCISDLNRDRAMTGSFVSGWCCSLDNGPMNSGCCCLPYGSGPKKIVMIFLWHQRRGVIVWVLQLQSAPMPFVVFVATYGCFMLMLPWVFHRAEMGMRLLAIWCGSLALCQHSASGW